MAVVGGGALLASHPSRCAPAGLPLRWGAGRHPHGRRRAAPAARCRGHCSGARLDRPQSCPPSPRRPQSGQRRPHPPAAAPRRRCRRLPAGLRLPASTPDVWRVKAHLARGGAVRPATALTGTHPTSAVRPGSAAGCGQTRRTQASRSSASCIDPKNTAPKPAEHRRPWRRSRCRATKACSPRTSAAHSLGSPGVPMPSTEVIGVGQRASSPTAGVARLTHRAQGGEAHRRASSSPSRRPCPPAEACCLMPKGVLVD